MNGKVMFKECMKAFTSYAVIVFSAVMLKDFSLDAVAVFFTSYLFFVLLLIFVLTCLASVFPRNLEGGKK